MKHAIETIQHIVRMTPYIVVLISAIFTVANAFLGKVSPFLKRLRKTFCDAVENIRQMHTAICRPHGTRRNRVRPGKR